MARYVSSCLGKKRPLRRQIITKYIFQDEMLISRESPPTAPKILCTFYRLHLALWSSSIRSTLQDWPLKDACQMQPPRIQTLLDSQEKAPSR